MMAQLEIGSPRNDRRVTQRRHVAYRNLVVVASDPPQERRDNSARPGGPPQSTSCQPPIARPNGLQCTRIAAHTVGRSAAWCRRRSGNNRVSPWCLEPIGATREGHTDLPTDLSGIRQRMNQEEGPRRQHEDIAAAVVAVTSALMPWSSARRGRMMPTRPDCSLTSQTWQVRRIALFARRGSWSSTQPSCAGCPAISVRIQMNRQEARALVCPKRERYRHPGPATASAPGRSRRIRDHGFRRPRLALGRQRMVGDRADWQSGREGRWCGVLRGMGRGTPVPPCRCGTGAGLCPCRNGSRVDFSHRQPNPVDLRLKATRKLNGGQPL